MLSRIGKHIRVSKSQATGTGNRREDDGTNIGKERGRERERERERDVGVDMCANRREHEHIVSLCLTWVCCCFLSAARAKDELVTTKTQLETAVQQAQEQEATAQQLQEQLSTLRAENGKLCTGQREVPQAHLSLNGPRGRSP